MLRRFTLGQGPKPEGTSTPYRLLTMNPERKYRRMEELLRERGKERPEGGKQKNCVPPTASVTHRQRQKLAVTAFLIRPLPPSNPVISLFHTSMCGLQA